MSAQFSVMPFRYSNNVAAMVAFLEELGLRRRIDSEGFAELHAGAGRVMVHAAGGKFAGGQTYLNLMTQTVEDAVDLASRIGLEYLVWDESYGRHAVVAGPHGEWMWINEEQADDYGYHRHDARPRADLIASAIRPAPNFAIDLEFFAHFGFAPDPGASEWFESLRGPGEAGIIGLHYAEASEPIYRAEEEDPRDRVPLARLGFVTGEELPSLAQRLTEAGYPATVVSEGGLVKVHVTDPDGVEIEIHPDS